MKSIRKVPGYKYVYGIIDFLIISFSFIAAAYLVRINYHPHYWHFLSYTAKDLIIFPFFAGFFVFIFDFNDLYKINIILTRAAHITSLTKSYLLGTFIVIVIAYMNNSSSLLDSRSLILYFLLISIPAFFLIRVELLRVLFSKLSSSGFRRKVIIVGDGKSGKLLAAKLHIENPVGIEVKGFVVEKSEESIFGKKILGPISKLQEITEKHNIDEIIIAVDNIDYEYLLKLLDTCHQLQVTVRVSSELFRIVHEKIRTEKYVDIPIIDVNPRYNTLTSFVLKRMFDFLLAFIAFVILIPFFIIIGALIKLTSPGPVLFIQKRIGKNGKSFDFYKFRSMYNNTNEDDTRKEMMIEFMRSGHNGAADTKIVNEARITKIGKILRKSSLDELPQLLNVLKGDMSLVGPRPCLPYEYEHYDSWQKRRLDVLPGCTGVWQTSGRSSVSFIDSIVLDLYYINNMSPWLDLQLILKTIPVMLFSRGGK